MTENKERKILFFDIDGTLITDDGKRMFPESAKRAIKSARQNGHLAFINTGRTFENVDDFIRAAGFDGYVCGCGTYIVVDDKELYHHKLTKERCVEIALLARECKLQAIFEHAKRTCYDKECPIKEADDLIDYFKEMGRTLVSDITDEAFVFDKFTAWYKNGVTDMETFVKGLPDFTFIEREGSFWEAVPKGFSKATGIKYLLDYYKIPIENAYVFGDSNNDLEMLQYVPNSIAMGVCSPEVKAIASYRTARVEEDGIRKAMEHFGIINS